MQPSLSFPFPAGEKEGTLSLSLKGRESPFQPPIKSFSELDMEAKTSDPRLEATSLSS